MPSDLNQCCVSTYQQWISLCSASCFDARNPNLEYLHLGSSQSQWVLVTDWNNALVIIGVAPISAQIISWGNLCWKGGSAFMLMQCDLNQCYISTYQEWTSVFTQVSFDDISAKFEYLCLGSSQSCCILYTDQSNALVIIGVAPISAWIIWWGIDTLFLIKWTIIETKGLPKSFNYLLC